MRIIIADPSLNNKAGHHYNLTLRISEAFAEHGHRVVWATHRDFVPDDADSNKFPNVAVFQHTMYDRYDPKTKADLPDNLDEVLADDIIHLTALLSLGPEDVLFFHTGYGDLYRAYVRIISQNFSYPWPKTHLCTPYDLMTMPAQDREDRLGPVFDSLVKLPQINRDLYLWTETALLAEHFNQDIGDVFDCLALPPSAVDHDQMLPFTKDGRAIISYLGAAREEKGFHLLPDLVDAVAKGPGAEKVKFFLQCTPQKIGYNSVISAAIDRLSAYSDDFVVLEKNPLSEPGYYSALASSDLLLLLYSEQTYRIRGSGIAVEAICAGVPIITFANTFCAHLIENGGGVIIGQAESIASAVQSAIFDLPDLKQSSERNRREFLKRHSKNKYVGLLETAPFSRAKYLALL